MKNTSIEWCDHTWNPWWGCTKVSPGCANCYAEKMGKRFGVEWGAGAERRLSSDRVWSDPFRWAKRGIDCGYEEVHWTGKDGKAHFGSIINRRPARVFALSMGDWLDGGPRAWPLVGQPQGGIPAGWMARMLDTIRLTPELHYILVTKRPENFFQRIQDVRYVAESATNFELIQWATRWAHGEPPPNVCVMASVEDQRRADERIPHLLRIPARWNGLSLEPLLGHVDLGLDRIGLQDPRWFWIVIDSETGPGASPCRVEWIESLVHQGRAAGCAVFVNQFGSEPDGIGPIPFLHSKGADPSEWPGDLRVREWPEGL